MYVLLIAIVALVFALLSFVFAVHVAIVYQRFNDGIKHWANSLDESIKDAINRSAREILRELDEKITEEKALERQELENEEDVEPLNIEENE